MTSISTHHLGHSYRSTRALHDVSIEIEPGEIYGLLGLNGAGKTTMIRILTGRLRPTSGRVEVLGKNPVESPSALRPLVGVVDSANLVAEARWSPARYLRAVAETYNLTQEHHKERVRECLEAVGLERFARVPMARLSGGNLRKIEIARCLVHSPRALFLDEPTREMDLPSKRKFWTLLKDRASDGVTVVLSSHDAFEISEACSRIGILRRGTLTWEGPVDALGNTVPEVQLSLERHLAAVHLAHEAVGTPR